MSQVRLRPLETHDLPSMFEWQSDAESNRMAVVNPRSRETFDAVWAKVLAGPEPMAYAILVDDEFVGYISCFAADGKHHVGYWLDKARWGRGIASRSLLLLLQLVTIRPLTATAATSNLASLRVLQKCGFTHVETRRDPATERYPECDVEELVLR